MLSQLYRKTAALKKKRQCSNTDSIQTLCWYKGTNIVLFDTSRIFPTFVITVNQVEQISEEYKIEYPIFSNYFPKSLCLLHICLFHTCCISPPPSKPWNSCYICKIKRNATSGSKVRQMAAIQWGHRISLLVWPAVIHSANPVICNALLLCTISILFLCAPHASEKVESYTGLLLLTFLHFSEG